MELGYARVSTVKQVFAVAPYSNLVAATAIVALGPFGDVGPCALVVA